MIKIMFICHGNICRSPMAEFVFKDMVAKQGRKDEFIVESSATSFEEIGNPVHRGTAGILNSLGINYSRKRAVHLEKEDYNKYDYLVCMDSANVRNALKIIGNDTGDKLHKLMEFANMEKDVADPWYTGDFNTTYKDVVLGCRSLLDHIDKKQSLKK